MIHDTLSNWHIYFHSPLWKQVFEFLSSLTPETADNTHIDLSGKNLYAAVMTYRTREPCDAVLETHDRYIDIQASLNKSEAIDWYPRSCLRIQKAYDPERDRTLYLRQGPAFVRINNLPGFFTVLFPQDAHMPQLMVGSHSEQVKKVVVKLRVDSLDTR